MSGGTRNRRSPSGALTDKILEQFIGTNALSPSATEYVAAGSPGMEAVESDAQITLPEAGVLKALAIENIVLGADPNPTVYNVRKNGVTIATGALPNNAPLAIIVIDVGVIGAQIIPDPLQFIPSDLLSIEAVTEAFPGASPKVRTTLQWTPGQAPAA